MKIQRRPFFLPAILLLAGAMIFVMVSGVLAAEKKTKMSQKSERGWLGVYIQNVDSDMQEALNLKSDEGVLINEVVDDSPADKAGMHEGDVIVEFDGKNAKDEQTLRKLIRDTKPDEKVDVMVMRDGKSKKLNVTMGEAPESSVSWNTGNFKWNPKELSLSLKGLQKPGIGIIIENLNDQLGDYFGVKDGNGVLVTEVMDDSPAQKAGIKAGDVIIKSDGQDVDDINELRETLAGKENGDKVELTVLRDKKEMTMTAEVSKDFAFSGIYNGMNWAQIAPGDIDLHVMVPEIQKKEMYKYRDDLRESVQELKEELQQLKNELKEHFKNLNLD